MQAQKITDKHLNAFWVHNAAGGMISQCETGPVIGVDRC